MRLPHTSDNPTSTCPATIYSDPECCLVSRAKPQARPTTVQMMGTASRMVAVPSLKALSGFGIGRGLGISGNKNEFGG